MNDSQGPLIERTPDRDVEEPVYRAPRIEAVLTSEELEREMSYAGQVTG